MLLHLKTMDYYCIIIVNRAVVDGALSTKQVTGAWRVLPAYRAHGKGRGVTRGGSWEGLLEGRSLLYCWWLPSLLTLPLSERINQP